MTDRSIAGPSQLSGITEKFNGTATQVTLVIAVITMGFYFAKHTLATVFQAYDDEGYMLISLAHYLSRGHLYRETFGQYGPFFFYAQQACFRILGLPVTHDAGRLVTLIYWMAAGMLGGWFVYKISRSLLLGAAAALACIRIGTVLANEPGHPQQVVLVLLLLACCVSASGNPIRKGMSLFFLGAVGAALFFTKINVGVFYMAALAQTLFCVMRPSRMRTVGLGLMLAYAVAIPVFLMRLSLHEAAVFCVIAILCGGVTFAFGSLCALEAPLPLGRALYAVAGFIAAGGLIVIGTLWQGMSVHTLIEGVLLQAAMQPLVFSRNLSIALPYLFVAVVIVGCTGAIWLFRERLSGLVKWIGVLRCAAGLAVLFLLLLAPNPLVVAAYIRLPLLAVCCAMLPLSVVPLNGRTWALSDLLPRIFIADLAMTQFLQAYPVAGSQVSIAGALMVLWAFVSIVDGIKELPEIRGRVFRPLLNTALSVLIIAVLSAGMFRTAFPVNGYVYPQSRLRGSASLHLPTGEEQVYEYLANNIAANCSVLFSMPGMNSFNFWSGVPTPNGSNMTGWMRAFSAERQKEILEILQAEPRSCVLYNKALVRFWGPTEEELQVPLARFITEDMTRVAEADDYEIKVNPKRGSPWKAKTYDAAAMSRHLENTAR